MIAAAAANPMTVLRIVLTPFVGRSPSLTWETQPRRSRCLVRRSVPRQKAALSRAEPLLDHERGGREIAKALGIAPGERLSGVGGAPNRGVGSAEGTSRRSSCRPRKILYASRRPSS